MSVTLTLTEAEAEAALRAACAQVGLNGEDATLIRMGDNAVYRLVGGRIIARVGRSAQHLDAVHRQVAVSRWLAANAVPAVHAVDVDQPVVADRRPVTFWESVSDEETYATTAQLGVILRRLHALPVPAPLQLPALDPFERAFARLDIVQISDDDRAFLYDRGSRLQDEWAGLNWVLPRCVLHGDANVGNTITDSDGTPYLSDLDSFSVGRAEWDLVQTGMFWQRFGWHTDEEYRAFVDAYGYDITAWDGFETLCQVREFVMVTWLAQKVDDAASADELAKRLETLRRNESRRGWSPL